MRHRFAVCLTLLAALSFTAIALAQDSPAPQPGRGPWGQGRGAGGRAAMGDPQAQLDRLATRLSLTDEQKDKIKPMLEQQSKQMQVLRQDSSLSREERFAKFQEIRQNTFSQIRPILTADQQKKLDQMTTEMQQRREQGRQRRGQGQGPAGQNPE